MADVGEALVGPFDQYLSEYDKMRRAAIDDRRDEEWPTAKLTLPKDQTTLPQTPTGAANAENILAILDKLGITDIPPASRLGLQAGIHDINAPSKEEMMKYLMVNEATGPDASSRVPLPRPRPRR